jgi:hypothetical protein
MIERMAEERIEGTPGGHDVGSLWNV